MAAAMGPGTALGSALDRQTDSLLRRVGAEGPHSAGKAGAGKAGGDGKIEKSAAEFESILLGTWLQQAQQSFATVPGGDGEDDDPAKDQLQGMAVQSLAGSLTALGGIGLARMIAAELHRSADRGSGQDKAVGAGAVGPPAVGTGRGG